MSIARNIANYASITGGLTGEVKMWSTTTAPTGYLLCDGSLISRTTFANLFAAIGTTFGAGDGSTTFALPDYRDRMPIGAGNTYNINDKGGSKDAIVPTHSHTLTDPGHGHGTDTQTATGNFYAADRSNITPVGVFFDAGGRSSSSLSGGGLTNDIVQVGINYAHSHTISGASTGISVAGAGVSPTNANLPPYAGIHFIIRYL